MATSLGTSTRSNVNLFHGETMATAIVGQQSAESNEKASCPAARPAEGPLHLAVAAPARGTAPLLEGVPPQRLAVPQPGPQRSHAAEGQQVGKAGLRPLQALGPADKTL